MSTDKKLDTLIPDIYDLLQREHTVSEENLKAFTEEIASVMRDRLGASKDPADRTPYLRCSNLGRKDRQLYFDMNVKPEEAKEYRTKSSDLLKFMYGDIVEALILFLAKEAGHEVTGEQGEIDIDGVKGHRDCIIDGITTDVKTASDYAFKKFSEGKLLQDDPFGYIGQISSYTYADNSPYGAFLASNKVTGELALLKIEKMDMIHPPTRIKELRDIIARKEPPPELCYPDIPKGKSGNMTINKSCSWCPHKLKCRKDANNGQGLRAFRYSQGLEYFTHVADTPRVEEVILPQVNDDDD